LDRVITILSSFLVLALINGFLYYQYDLPNSGLFNDQPSVPYIILVFGQPIQIFVLLLIHLFLRSADRNQTLGLWIGDSAFSDGRSIRLWELLSTLIVLALPIVAFTWAWIRFMTSMEVYISAGSSPPRYRYGKSIGDEGADYFPILSPSFMVVCSVIIFVWSIMILRRGLALRRS
jgi:hypothetical protein